MNINEQGSRACSHRLPIVGESIYHYQHYHGVNVGVGYGYAYLPIANKQMGVWERLLLAEVDSSEPWSTANDKAWELLDERKEEA